MTPHRSPAWSQGGQHHLFTTGRGSVFGGKPVPSLKLATNTPMYLRMENDMDINCGDIVDGTSTVEEKGQEIFKRVVACALVSSQNPRSWAWERRNSSLWVVGAIL
ncbi:MAG: hypothetical protein CM1200mP18_09420 [Gammaproteobacteria bacterium]|nr:MAG: hypothetical protein CM1200mP18_09420 [Gammaproteobacteria bacterium]